MLHTELVAKPIAGDAQDHWLVRVHALEQVELAIVLCGCPSERCHILNEDHPPSKHIEIYWIPLQGRGFQIIEGLRDERHGTVLFCSYWQ